MRMSRPASFLLLSRIRAGRPLLAVISLSLARGATGGRLGLAPVAKACGCPVADAGAYATGHPQPILGRMWWAGWGRGGGLDEGVDPAVRVRARAGLDADQFLAQPHGDRARRAVAD